MRTLLALTLCLSSGALAIAKGGTLYVSGKDVGLLKEAKPSALLLLRVQRGTAVVWLGPGPKGWQEIEVAGKRGFVLQSGLSPNKPQLELDSTTGKEMSTEAFASSGAVIGCHFGPPGGNYQTHADQSAAAELIYLEQFNLAKATPAALQAKERELSGP